MKILFLHQNFPGQWPHLARYYSAKPGCDVLALTDARNQQPDIVKTIRYPFSEGKVPKGYDLAHHFAEKLARAEAVAMAASKLKSEGYEPDLIAAHGGWGETLLLREVWPRARQVVYAEFYYRTEGADVDFDPEFGLTTERLRWATHARNAVMMSAMADADRGLAPTKWQAGGFPDWVANRIDIIHDGVDTQQVAPNPNAFIELSKHGVRLRPGDELVTFVNRNLEPYRGYHIFMRALPRILAERPNARVVLVGGDAVSYGRSPPAGQSWRQIFLREVQDKLDLSRVHFVGRVAHQTYLHMLQVSAAHVYMTYPFVLSWSMIEAMAAGCLVIGSRTAPVEEVISHGRNGLLFDFFDKDALASAVIDALARPDDYRGLREAARRTAIERYDLHSVCLPQLTGMFERVAAGSVL